jgi:glycosyltransferase involved in cell wall biosynthesis
VLTGESTLRPPHESANRRQQPIKVLFVVTELGTGGAEQMLLNLLTKLDRKAFEPVVASLHPLDDHTAQLAGRIRELGITIHDLRWNSVAQSVRALASLRSLIRSLEPAIVQGWMVHANLTVQVTNLLSRDVPVVWDVQHSVQGQSTAVGVIMRALRYLSPYAARIIYCSRTSALEHEQLGYDASRTCVIPNGFDCERFRPRPESRRVLRDEIGVSEFTPVIGLVARAHPQKDHGTFLNAAKRLVESGANAHFVLAGLGTDVDPITSQISALELQGRVHALGKRHDVPQVTAALDIATCSSITEGFPLILGEAMACGVPCASTDIGDCRFMIEDTGRIVPPRNPAALSDAWGELLSLGPEGRRALGEAARVRILENFSIEAVASHYEQVYKEIVNRGPSAHNESQSSGRVP